MIIRYFVLQECLCMEELQSALHKHLGGTIPQKAQP